jgi:hypothetical protein
VIIAVSVAIRKDPCGYYLIHGAEEAMGGNGNGNVSPENAGFLAFTQDAFDYIKVFHQKVMRELAKELGAMPKLSLEHNGQTAI